MLNVRTGSAAVSRIAQKNPMEILSGLMDDNATASADQLFSLWLSIVREDEDLLVPALRHTFTNMLSCLERSRRPPSRSGSSKEAETKEAAKEAKKTAVEKAKTVIVQSLSKLKLPSGEEVCKAKFGAMKAAGGWFARVGEMGEPDAIVGDTLSEEDLRKAWEGGE